MLKCCCSNLVEQSPFSSICCCLKSISVQVVFTPMLFPSSVTVKETGRSWSTSLVSILHLHVAAGWISDVSKWNDYALCWSVKTNELCGYAHFCAPTFYTCVTRRLCYCLHFCNCGCTSGWEAQHVWLDANSVWIWVIVHIRPFCTTISVYLLGSLDVSLSTLRTAHTGTLCVCEVRFDVLWNDAGTFQSEQKVLMCWRRSSRCSSFPRNDPLPHQCRRGLWKHPRGTPLQYANKHPNTVIIALHFLLTTTASLLCAVWCSGTDCVVMEIQERDSLILRPSSGNWLHAARPRGFLLYCIVTQFRWNENETDARDNTDLMKRAIVMWIIQLRFLFKCVSESEEFLWWYFPKYTQTWFFLTWWKKSSKYFLYIRNFWPKSSDSELVYVQSTED